MSKTTKTLCALGVCLLSAEAGASLYEIHASGLAADTYLDSSANAVSGWFDAAGVLPVGAVIRRATVQFAFQDETDYRERLESHNYPDIGDFVELDPVYVGVDVYHRHVRPYYRISDTLYRYERERIDVALGGASIGVAEPLQTETIVRTEGPGTWQYDHGGSYQYYIGEDSSGHPLFGTSYVQYYNNIIPVDITDTMGNEEHFSLSSLLDSTLYPGLANGGSLNFSLGALSGDALFKSALLTIETFDGTDVPEPSSIFLVSAGAAGLGMLRRRGRPGRG